MKRPDFAKLVPPGYDVTPELRGFAALSFIAALYSLGFFFRLYNCRQKLFSYVRIGNELRRMLDPGAEMERFPTVLEDSFDFFLIPAALALLYIVLHYAYHWQGSRSIYLMRRLPNKWLLHRLCLTLPLLGLVVTAAAVLVLTALYYGIYRLATPAGCLPPQHWLPL